MARTHSEMSNATKALLKVIAPLTTREERNATAAAVKHLARELSQQYRIFPPELRIDKPSKPNSAPKRAIAVLVFDYGNRLTTEVVVDTLGKLIRKTDLTGFQPAFLPEEIQEARDIAEGDSRVARASGVRGAFTSAFGPHAHGKRGARLVGLRYVAFDKKQNVRPLGEAVVDLSARKLVHFENTQEEEQ